MIISDEIKVYKRRKITSLLTGVLKTFNLYWLPNYQDEYQLICKYLKEYKINLVLDIGASIGNFSFNIRKYGYQFKIISFEPIIESYQILEKRSSKDVNWFTVNKIISDKKENIKFNISKNLVSSSVLQINENHILAEPNSKYVESRIIESVDINDFITKSKRIFLKIDTQGTELKILKSIKNWDSIVGIKIEVSINSLYFKSDLMDSVLTFMKNKKFNLHNIEPGFRDLKNGRLLQVDFVYFKSNYR